MDETYIRLINWRDKKTKEENIAEDKKYFILPNSTIKNIVSAKPKGIDDLSKVKGIGKKKLKQYGNEIIGLVNGTQTTSVESIIYKDTLFSSEFSSPKNISEDLPEDIGEHKQVIKNEQVLTISQLNNHIKQILNNSFKVGVWVCGEIYRYDLDIIKANSRPYGQVYFELVEQDPQTKERKATISSMIWGEDRNIIETKMRAISSGLVLKDGLQIKAKCFVDFYPPAGKIQIRITDIEPEYTIGKMAMERKLLIEKLRKTGLLDKNKKIEIPLVPLNIGLITSSGSAAYNDFVDELRKSGYAFKVFLCDARMQGTDLEGEVKNAIYTLNKYHIDVIAIVRGGGSASDLMGFDKEGVAVAIANSENPVLTGIGHQIDRTVADEVSNQSFKTPTATAQFVVGKVQDFEAEAEDKFSNILTERKQIIDFEFDNLKNMSRHLKSATLMFTQNLENNILQIKEKIIWNLVKFFESSFRKLDELERVNNSKNPVNILKLGFGLVYGTEGGIIKSVASVSVGSDIKIKLRDGNLGGKIISKEKN